MTGAKTGAVTGTVGSHLLSWCRAPRGREGEAELEAGLDGRPAMRVRWRRDEMGLWIECPHGVFGYDIEAIRDEEGVLSYRVERRGGGESWEGLAFKRPGDETETAGGGRKQKGTRVRAQMPGKIVRVLVAEGASVAKDQPVLVMEAMKMENEIRAPRPGRLARVLVEAGQAVDTGAELALIEPET